MNVVNLNIRYNVLNLSSLESFADVRGGINGGCKDVYFVRMTGADSAFAEKVEKMDAVLTKRQSAGQCRYHRMSHFPKPASVEETRYYTNAYDAWSGSGKKEVTIKCCGQSGELKRTLSDACNAVMGLFKRIRSVSTSMEKNFAVKLLYWLDKTSGEFLSTWEARQSMKFVIENVTKVQEYLFCYLLTRIGVDVLLLQYREDIDEGLESLCLSKKIELGAFEAGCRLTAYDAASYMEISQFEPEVRQEPQQPVTAYQTRRNGKERNPGVQGRRELDFEELALCASSVVMITIHDTKGKAIGSGSGIMIGRDGYILTNSHVASGGRFYSVRIEDEEQVYRTDEVIKYNPVLDLAVLRIQRRLNPLPLYRSGNKLVRGQKVVAIGSPLGLFNSVSDGIISGFRRIRDVDMIQFTAPISHGSSGGAVLNMFGEVIGISTAGFDDGQNINLAVGYESIQLFIRGFT